MAGFIKVEAKKLPTKALNMQINKEIFYEFKVKCKERGLPLNIVIEVFMRQYGNRKYHLDKESILKWQDDNGETETLNSTFNKEVCERFKDAVKYDGYRIKYVIAAFVEDYVKNDLIMEYTINRKG
jgi:hypothetical protein